MDFAVIGSVPESVKDVSSISEFVEIFSYTFDMSTVITFPDKTREGVLELINNGIKTATEKWGIESDDYPRLWYALLYIYIKQGLQNNSLYYAEQALDQIIEDISITELEEIHLKFNEIAALVFEDRECCSVIVQRPSLIRMEDIGDSSPLMEATINCREQILRTMRNNIKRGHVNFDYLSSFFVMTKMKNREIVYNCIFDCLFCFLVPLFDEISIDVEQIEEDGIKWLSSAIYSCVSDFLNNVLYDITAVENTSLRIVEFIVSYILESTEGDFS